MTGRNHRFHFILAGLFVGILLMISPPSVVNAAFTGEIPTGYWLMDELDPPLSDEMDAGTSNDMVSDLSDPSENATDAVVNVSQTFDGVDDGIMVMPSGARDKIFDWEEDGSFSIEVWFKITADAGNLNTNNETEVIVGRDDNSSDDAPLNLHWWIGVRNVDGNGVRVAARMRDQEGDGNGVLVANENSDFVVVNDGEWHHAVLVKDGDPDSDPITTTSQLRLYVDGVLEDTDDVDYTTATGEFGLKSGDTPMGIGYLRTTTSTGVSRNFQFNGGIDQLALYGSALTPSNIEQNFKIGLAGANLDDEFAPVFLTTDFGMTALGYLFSANAEPIGNPAVTSFSLGTSPTGLTLNTMTGDVSWMATDQQSGLNNFNISATNTVGTTNQALSVEIVDVCADLSSYWNLDETTEPFSGQVTGTPTHDAVCTGGAATCPAVDASPKAVGALTFDGVDDGLDVIASPAGDLVFDWTAAESFTIEFFMKADGTLADGDTEVMVGRVLTGVAGPQWWVGLRDDAGGGVTPRLFARLEAVNGDGDGEEITNTTNPTTITADTWFHVAMVFDHTSDTVSLYLDGQLETSRTIAFNDTTDFASTSNNLNIGHFGNGFLFSGGLDEIAFIGSAVDPALLLQHATMNSGRGFCNDAPMITTVGAPTATQGAEYTYNPAATDAETDTYTWLLVTQPTGMTINSSTGAISWTPNASVAGTNVNVELQVQDDFGGTDTELITIAVAADPNANQPPTITSTAPTTANNGSLYTYTAVVSDPDTGDTFTWTLTNAPGDMAVSTSGVVTWTPADGVTTSGDVTLTVSDGTDTGTEILTITVSPATGGGGGGGGGGCFIHSAGGEDTVDLKTLAGMIALAGVGLLLGTVKKNRSK